ncbi:MAG: RluA family pseudouridine synthase [bacterium]
MKNKFIVKKNKANERVDKFIVKKLPQFSRSTIQKNIKDGLILVNGQKVSPHYFLKENDLIEIEIKKIEKEIEEKKIDLKADKLIPFKIIFENEDFLVVDKPAGLVVHPSKSSPEGTLANALLAYCPKIEKVGEDLLRPGLVHRLDKDVSGLLVVAKNQKIFSHLKEQFSVRMVKKEYLALVYGKLSRDEGTIDFDIVRSKKKRTLMAAIPQKTGRAALTQYEVIKKFVNYSFLKLTIKTGRTHQIRVHLKAIGHPLVGDQFYKIKKYKEKIKLNRVFLHATTLGFFDSAKKWQEFHSPLPKELEEILENLI